MTTTRYAELLDAWNQANRRARREYQSNPTALGNGQPGTHDPQCATPDCANTSGKRGRYCWKCRNQHRQDAT